MSNYVSKPNQKRIWRYSLGVSLSGGLPLCVSLRMRSHLECGPTWNALPRATRTVAQHRKPLPSGAASPLFNHMLISEFWHTLVPGWSAASHFAHEKSTFSLFSFLIFLGKHLAFFEMFVFSLGAKTFKTNVARICFRRYRIAQTLSSSKTCLFPSFEKHGYLPGPESEN